MTSTAKISATELDTITGQIIDAAIALHRNLGPGLLEHVYEVLLADELTRRGLRVVRQQPVAITHAGRVFDEAFRADLLVAGKVIVEIKSIERLAPVHTKQLLTYLRMLNLPVGLLLNFNAATLREGLHRVINRLEADQSPALRINQPSKDAPPPL
jgi:iron complex transport system substrate-binding protein